MLKFILSFILLLYPLVGQAATQTSPAWRQITLNLPQTWDSSLALDLEMDEEHCRQDYGDNWYQACYVFFGEYESRAQGIQLNATLGTEQDKIQDPNQNKIQAPDQNKVPTINQNKTQATPPPQAKTQPTNLVPGDWFFVAEDRLEFRPAQPKQGLQPDTAYTLDLSKFPLPAWTKLNTTKLEFKTLPLGVGITKENIFIDPSLKSKHVFSIDLRFNYPVDPLWIRQNLQIKPSSSQLKLGQAEFIWSQTKDNLTISVPIISLSPQATSLSLELPLPWGVFENDTFKLNIKNTQTNAQSPAKNKSKSKPSYQNLNYSFRLPGQKEIFNIKDASLSLEHDAKLNQEYRINLASSLQLLPSEILKNLELYILPQYNSSTALTPCDWLAAPKIMPEDLQKAVPVQISFVGSDANSNLQLKLEHLDLKHDSYLFLNLKPDLTATNGLKLGKAWTKILKLPSFNPEINFLQTGQVLALSSSGQLPVQVSQIDKLSYELKQIRQPFLALIASQSGFNPLWNPDQVSQSYQGELPVANLSTGQAQIINLDLAQMLGKKPPAGLWQLQLKGYKQGELQTRHDRSSLEENRLFLLTDLGILAKEEADGSLAVFINNLKTGQPVPEVQVQALGYNGQVILSAPTNAQGLARLPKLRHYTKEKQIVAIIASTVPGNASNSAPAKATANATSETSDLAWLPLNDVQRLLDYTAFPIAGQKGSAGLQAFVFSQRGIYRPGETLHFGLLLRQQNMEQLPNLPVRAILRNPAGREVLNQILTAQGQGLNSLSWESSSTALSGRYRLDIEIVKTTNSANNLNSNNFSSTNFAEAIGSSNANSIIGSTSVRMEEFQPDSMALTAHIKPQPPQQGWLSLAEVQDQVQIEVKLRNLHGLPAQDRRLRAEVQTELGILQFPGYAEYIFQDPLPYASEFLNQTLPEVRTNAQGEASFTLPLNQFKTGTQSISVLLEGFEPGGGRAVSLKQQLLVSPLENIVGYQTQGIANLDFIEQNQQASLKFIALNSKLQPVALNQLQASISERRYVTSLVQDSDGKYRYEDLAIEKELSSTALSITPEAANSFTLPTAKAGEYLLTLKDAANLTVAKISFNVVGQDLKLANQQGYPSNLRLKLPKTQYQAGETVKLQLSTPYAGYGLITLERDQVATATWFKAEAGESLHSLTLPQDFAGRGYINVIYIRDLSSPELYAKPVSVAVAPIEVDLVSKQLDLKLEAPRTAKPGSMFTAKLITASSSGQAASGQAASGQAAPGQAVPGQTASEQAAPGQALVIAVDEGILQLTKFKTPDPLDYLFLDRSLDVATRQAFDLLMFDGKLLQNRAAFGGDLVGAGGRFFNPFKRKHEPPLCYWSGVVDLKAGVTEISFPIPSYYNGQIRLMVVAANATQSLSLSSETTVAAELIIQPQLPTHLAPGDSFTGYLNISNNLATEQNFKISYDLGELQADNSEIARSGSDNSGADNSGATNSKTATTEPDNSEATSLASSISLAPGHEKVIALKLKVPTEAALGNTNLKFTVGEFTRNAQISIRPASPKTTTIQAGQKTQSPIKPMPQAYYAEEHEELFSLSSLPVPAIQALTAYLDNYEQGCMEQLISRSFPYIYLLKRPELLSSHPDKLEEIQTKALKLISSTQAQLAEAYTNQGVLAWPETSASSSEPQDLLTVYAFDWLLSLHEAGFQVSGGLLQNLGNTVESISQRSPNALSDGRTKAYALWLLTREGRITTQAIEQLMAQLDEQAAPWAEDLTGSFLAAALKIMHLDAKAQELWNNYNLDPKTFQPQSYLDLLASQALHSLLQVKYFNEPQAAKNPVAQTIPKAKHSMAPSAVTDLINSSFAALASRNYSTFSSSLSLRALLATLPSSSESTKNYLAQLAITCPDSTAKPTMEITDFSLNILNPQCQSYLVSEAKQPNEQPKQLDKQLYWQLTTTGYPKNPPAISQGINLEKQYLDPSTLQPIQQVALGDEVLVQITVQAPGQGIADAILTDLLPGGFEMILKATDSPLRLNRAEDRIFFYGDLSPEKMQVSYRLRAVNPGLYLAPGVLAEAMYDQNKLARTSPTQLEIIEPQR